jgi:hypothetical protein
MSSTVAEIVEQCGVGAGYANPLFFYLLNLLLVRSGVFFVNTVFLFSYLSICYKEKWRPQGEAILSLQLQLSSRVIYLLPIING